MGSAIVSPPPPANSYAAAAAAARREDSEVTGTLTWANVANATFPARRGINCAVCYVYHGDAEATSPLQGSTLLRLFRGRGGGVLTLLRRCEAASATCSPAE